MNSENAILEKSMDFAVRVVNLYKYLSGKKREHVLAKQLLRSGTSIGANVREATQGQSRKDFTAKMSISLKEATETAYWLELLYKTGYLTKTEYQSIDAQCQEIIRILISIVKSMRAENS